MQLSKFSGSVFQNFAEKTEEEKLFALSRFPLYLAFLLT